MQAFALKTFATLTINSEIRGEFIADFIITKNEHRGVLLNRQCTKYCIENRNTDVTTLTINSIFVVKQKSVCGSKTANFSVATNR